jgi:hypothetical protein
VLFFLSVFLAPLFTKVRFALSNQGHIGKATNVWATRASGSHMRINAMTLVLWLSRCRMPPRRPS